MADLYDFVRIAILWIIGCMICTSGTYHGFLANLMNAQCSCAVPPRLTVHPSGDQTASQLIMLEPGCRLAQSYAQPGHQVLRCLGAVYSITTFIRDIRTLLQIRQFAHLRSATGSMQGLNPTRRSARATPSRDPTLGVAQDGDDNVEVTRAVGGTASHL